MKLFITGGAGFIGSNFIHYIMEKEKDIQICNYDKLTYAGNLSNLKGIDEKRYQFIKADICDYKTLKESLMNFNPSAIIAFAAETHVDRSITSPQEFLETNILGTECVLRATRDLKISRLLHISTDEVYGSLEIPYEAKETQAFDPNSPYSASKAAGDMLCHAYHITYEVPVSIVRGSNCYGKLQYPEKFIPRSITNIINGCPIGIYGNGNNMREWVYTEDFCRGVEIVLHKGLRGEAYNLGGGSDNRYTNNVVANKICNLMGKYPDHFITYIDDRRGHDKRYALDSTKLKNLGWKPKYNFSEGLSQTIQWYKDNPDWWKPLL